MKTLFIILFLFIFMAEVSGQVSGVYRLIEQDGQVADTTVDDNLLILKPNQQTMWGYESIEEVFLAGQWKLNGDEITVSVSRYNDVVIIGQVYYIQDTAYIEFPDKRFKWFRKYER